MAARGADPNSAAVAAANALAAATAAALEKAKVRASGGGAAAKAAAAEAASVAQLMSQPAGAQVCSCGRRERAACSPASLAEVCDAPVHPRRRGPQC